MDRMNATARRVGSPCASLLVGGGSTLPPEPTHIGPWNGTGEQGIGNWELGMLHYSLFSILCFLFTRCAHSHSMVEGGLEEMSSTTRLTPAISLQMRAESRCRMSLGR